MKRLYSTIDYKIIDSTNNEAKKLLLDGKNLVFITACEQTAGRGQRGNSWHSTPGLNLTCSGIFAWGRDYVPAIPASKQFIVSMITAESVVFALQQEGIECQIKWPNDIYYKDLKICGILIEHSVRGRNLCTSIIGVGLNINETEFPSNIPNPTSMALINGKSYDTTRMLYRFIACFESLLKTLEEPDGEELISNEYLRRMYLKDIPHIFTDTLTGQKFTGIIRSVADNACLIVEMPDGQLREFAFKEISYF